MDKGKAIALRNAIASLILLISNQTDDLNQLKTDVAEILRILLNRNGGSGI
jgi:hypothetical protein